MSNTIDTVIFDLDGTLVDSQPAALGASIQALAQFGVKVTEDDLRQVFGGGARKLLSHFLERDLGPEQTEEKIEEAIRLRAGLQLDLISKVELLPQVKELLESLRSGGYRMAMATMSSRSVVDSVLGHHDIQHYFAAVTTADDVTRVKPDPEILGKTMDKLGGQVRSTMYVGDSAHDMEASVAMGMPFLLVDSGIYIRGEMREKLLAEAQRHGFPVVGLHGLMDVPEAAKNHS
ncbi:MAG TPA: hypothetical protein DHW65_08785 [Dehalococcoidia bacterium]|nr:hypothetical protein [Chloroflexota bacterium]MQF95999.1 HAD family hydrolase [SAR202 cluster bacterium]HAA94832.1 hypothetical protein [Dehalococcoidia bacterium]HCL26422.1 hypothetical protein [Dehalococcoidia bacterium]|tara:strand:- start:5267 stop:5965 length:699 start_codon:yes stop_codon:yes gene_type:complete